MLQTLLGRFGIYYCKRRYMPRGLDWLWDLDRLIPAGTIHTVVDVGANEGQTSIAVLKAFPSATVHAFEPVAATFQILRQALGTDHRMHLNQSAVSSAAGVVHIQAQSQLSHIVPASLAGGLDVESVEAVTLDTYCEQHHIAHIDILKTDTEGHDLQVLTGAKDLFRAGKIGWVFVEVTFDSHDLSHSQFGAICEWLDAHGMAPWCFYDTYHSDSGRNLLFCNVLFGRRAVAHPASPAPSLS